jgi:hypothetical protein
MEPNDQHSNIIYDDQYCFINHKGELWRKASSITKQKKIADLDLGNAGSTASASAQEPDSATKAVTTAGVPDFESHLQNYRKAFEELSRGTETVLNEAESPEELDHLKAELAQSNAIGDFGLLASQIDKADTRLQEQAATPADAAADEPTGVKDHGQAEIQPGPQTGSPDDAPTSVQPVSGSESALETRSGITHEADEQVTEPGPEPEAISEEEPEAAAAAAKAGTEAEAEPAEKPAPDTPGAPEPGKTEETPSAASGEEQYYLDLVAKAEEYARLDDWAHVPQLFGLLYDSWNEGPELGDQRKNELRNLVDAALQNFNQRKSEHYDHLKEKRQKNLDQRVSLLERLQKIVDQKRWQAAGEAASIRRKWDDLRQLPSGAPVEEQNNAFNALMDTFDENRVDFLVRAREKEEENLIGKLVIMEKMGEVTAKAGPDTENWQQLDNEMEELTRQWRKIKHIPKEKEDEIWNRFKSVRDSYFLAKAEHDEAYKKELDKNIRIRQRLIRKAVALLEEKDLAKGVRTINRLHNEWKKTGPVPKELNDQLWEEFKTASDEFNKIKTENADLIREQESENYDRKVELCEKAEALSNADNWKTAADEMTQLLEQWKKIGPVPRKKNNTIWNRFRTAMDEFYKKRREYFKESRVDQKENLEKKKEIIGKILALAETEDADDAIGKVKPLQDEFKGIGFVPIKQKNSIWEEYKAALDKVYGKARSSHRGGGSDRGDRGDRGGRVRHGVPDSGDRRSQQEIFRLRRECDELRDTINRYNDTMTYIKPNKKGLELRQEIQNSIDEAEKTLQEKQSKIEELSAGG